MTEKKETMDAIISVEEPSNPDAAVRIVGETLEKLFESSGVEMVYGRPVRREDHTIIPMAEVMTGIGFGVGYGSGEMPQQEEGGPTGAGGGGGGGGGGRTVSRPVAVVIAGPDGVRVEPVVDVTKIALATFTAFGFIFSQLAKMRRGPAE